MKKNYKSQQQKTTTYHWTKMENTKVLLILMGPFTMPSHWCIIDSQVTSFQHTEVLLILRLPHSSILMCYWFSGYLIPAYWCVIDYHVTSFQHTDVLMILMWPHFTIPMCYWFSWYLILQHTDVLLTLMWPYSSNYRSVVDSQVTSF